MRVGKYLGALCVAAACQASYSFAATAFEAEGCVINRMTGMETRVKLKDLTSPKTLGSAKLQVISMDPTHAESENGVFCYPKNDPRTAEVTAYAYGSMALELLAKIAPGAKLQFPVTIFVNDSSTDNAYYGFDGIHVGKTKTLRIPLISETYGHELDHLLIAELLKPHRYDFKRVSDLKLDGVSEGIADMVGVTLSGNLRFGEFPAELIRPFRDFSIVRTLNELDKVANEAPHSAGTIIASVFLYAGAAAGHPVESLSALHEGFFNTLLNGTGGMKPACAVAAGYLKALQSKVTMAEYELARQALAVRGADVYCRN